MAVYTPVEARAAETFAARFGLGPVTALTGILEGVENTNYKLSTETGTYVLTLFERRVHEDDLPYFLGLMTHLAERNIPCPVPIKETDGAAFASLKGKPAAILSFLPGSAPTVLDPATCRVVGRLLASIHLEARDFPLSRPNDLSLSGWRAWFERCGGTVDRIRPGLQDMIGRELDFLEEHWPHDLPSGVVHADLFPDNIFMRDSRVSGVIDFYFAANDLLAYDLAVCLNAWCFDEDDRLNRQRSEALVAGYESLRPLSKVERSALPILCRGAAVRFFVTRAYDWQNTAETAHVRPKDPLEFADKLQWHQSAIPTSYA